ncbi:MAG: flavodoxin family protein [Pyramidobacter sp.]|nr:flavodoxin family protein [Pyramidobacter sp.]
MKVLLINGSPHAQGNTALALGEAARELEKLGVQTETLHIGNKDIRGCISCGTCFEKGKCVFDDAVNEAAAKLAEADGLIVGSPVYYASPNGTLLSFLDRLFFSTGALDKTMNVGASVVVCRRGGASASFDALNKYFTICGMPVVSSQYWNSVHGLEPGEAAQDGEGLQTMHTLARNMAFLMRAIADAKAKYGLPEKEEPIFTHFIH